MVTRNIRRSDGSNFLHLCQFLVCSGKSHLSNYVNAHCLQISIWTWLMPYHDITTYDISRGSPSLMTVVTPIKLLPVQVLTQVLKLITPQDVSLIDKR